MHVPAENDAWWVQVRGKSYGPYSAEQMGGYVAEGRVRPASMVARSPEGPWSEARSQGVLMASLGANRAFARAPANDSGEADLANLFVFAEIHSGAWNRFMAALESMGILVELAPGLWLLRTRKSVGVVRNTVTQTLELGDRFVAIDATRDRLAWYNLGPEIDVRIRDAWNSQTPALGGEQKSAS